MLKDINIMCQVLTLEYGKDCSSHGNWNVAVITARGLGTVVVKRKLTYLSSSLEQRLSTRRSVRN